MLIKGSESMWLRERASKAPFVRRAVSRFMPGESFDDMIGAARVMAGQGVQAVFTRLGEGVKDVAEAEAVLQHYLEGIERIARLKLACEPSIKLTQLGLDIDRDLAYGHLRTLASHTHSLGTYLWVDMEQSSYVDVTLDFVRRLKSEWPGIGVCLQAYLFRTREDLVDLVGRGIGVRLVKGAYNEPATIAFPKKSEVDANYLALAQTMLEPGSRVSGARAVFGTHDAALIDTIRRHASSAHVSPAEYEFHMLYGIQRAEQFRLAREGASVRVLIAYGSYWFPWYMRRLAERPANVWFVARSVFS
jgi:proline dehydrogenase